MGKALKWRLLSLLMWTLGRASNGIDLGYRYGFDSGKMLDYVYENQPGGRYLYGLAVDKLYLNTTGWRAVRERKALLKAVLGQEINRLMENSGDAVVLGVAAGPGRYLQEVVIELGRPERLMVICRDLDEAGLAQGREQAAKAGLLNFRFEVGDACDLTSLAQVEPRPNLVVASGLYENLPDRALIHRSMVGIHSLLQNDGRFIFTTLVLDSGLEFVAKVLTNRLGRPWIVEQRTLKTVEQWAMDAGFHDLVSHTESLGLFAVTVGIN